MKDLQIDKTTHDLTFGIVKDDDEIIQSGLILLNTRKGEFAFDKNMGLSQSEILGKEFNQAYAVDDIKNAVTQDPRIVNVEDVEFSVIDRQATATFKAMLANNKTVPLEVVIDES